MWRSITGRNFYKKIYSPIYNQSIELHSEFPRVFNKFGEPMNFYFIRDKHTAHFPYIFQSNYFVWDRFNIGLKTHFYSHNSMLETMGNPDRRFGMFIESEAIVPEDYCIFEKHKGLEKDFDAILTYSDKLLNSLSNARFVPFCAQPWYGNQLGGGQITNKAYENKTKNISIVSSDKTYCELHKKRIMIANQLKSNNLADTFGTFDGGVPVKVCDMLTDYRYSIGIENYVSDYFFTERLTNCFVAMTVPIYFGARKIPELFNPDGIIFLKETDLDCIVPVLAQCSENDYEQRLPAIIDNFNRVMKFINIDDYLYEVVNNKL